MRKLTKFTLLTTVLSIAVCGGVSAAFAQPEEIPGTRSPLEDYQSEKDRVGDHRDVPRDQPAGVQQQECPFTCNSQGYSHSGCKEWREGDTCFIAPKD